jgi:hypothetical protein
MANEQTGPDQQVPEDLSWFVESIDFDYMQQSAQ